MRTWFPVNYLLIEALERYHHLYGAGFEVEFPTSSGRRMSLNGVARELASRLAGLFLADQNGRRPWQGRPPLSAADPRRKDLTLFHEYFDAESGRGLGASHQTGWTSLITRLI